MKLRMLFALHVMVPVVLLSACAAAPPAHHNAVASAVAPAPEAGLAAAPEPAKVSGLKRASKSNYGDRRRVVKDGTEYYCKRDQSTGSRARVFESCMTREQLDLLAASGQKFIDDIIRSPSLPEQDSMGGANMGPVPIATQR